APARIVAGRSTTTRAIKPGAGARCRSAAVAPRRGAITAGGKARSAEIRSLAAPLALVVARARRRPARWLLPALGLAVATAFTGAVAAEGVIAGDQGAHTVLLGLSPLQRSVRVTWQGAASPAVERRGRALLRRLDYRSRPRRRCWIRCVWKASSCSRPLSNRWIAGWSPAGRWARAQSAHVRCSRWEVRSRAH